MCCFGSFKEAPFLPSVCWVWEQCDWHNKLDIHLRLDHLGENKQRPYQADSLSCQLQVSKWTLAILNPCKLDQTATITLQGSHRLCPVLHRDLKPDLQLQFWPDAWEHGLQQLHPNGGARCCAVSCIPLQEGYCGVTYREVSGTTPDAFSLLPNPSPGTVVTCPASFINIPKLRYVASHLPMWLSSDIFDNPVRTE